MSRTDDSLDRAIAEAMRRPVTLALDLGTKTGWALGGADVPVVSGVQSFANDRFSGGGMRYLRFRRWLDEIAGAHRLSRVSFEEVRAHRGTDAAHVYGGLMGQLTAWCEEKALPYGAVPVGTIKRFATGKGNAGKPAMIAAVESWGFTPADDNEADALALLHYEMAQAPSTGEEMLE